MNISKTAWINVMPELAGWKNLMCTGLSMNILHVGDKSPVQRCFFTNSVGDLLPAQVFLGGLDNFSNFVIIFF